MIDEKTLPPPDRAGGAASPPPAYPEPSFSRAQQLSPTVSSPTSLSASSSSPYPTQTSRNFSQPQQEVVLQPPPMGIPEPVTPPINESNVPSIPARVSRPPTTTTA
ncbi:hypothetical protein QCA50_019290 [Cerrena zonata]|uniref:Uncharacterized protein n=1 Tax=Cerrena zonata TaxID=2478898 RepID=A0AAW0F9P5_9APHY